ncbi:FUSC family protein [Caballeronia mineralivorans]|uniref:FUSC family protein n=1 Tax=Caballeronia mineralivorans TaxID=2010198 RepID=UPI002AFF7D07|nr:FUSC family protein [Caballeronia mineralivorans]MEA3097059.1 multidrug resistance protein MdtO [Caballeronia mineralivorans]
MAALARRVESRTPFLAFLAQELAPREGRWLAVTRIAAGSTITVAIAMVFRIPLAAYMAYMVFLASKDDIAGTARMVVAACLAITLGVIFSLGLAQISLGDPAIRLPAMALTTFLAMFSARTFALGPISFLAGFIVVTMQSVVDQVPTPEAFTRLTLWLWVVVVVPVAVTMLINLLFGPAASAVAERGVKKLLTDLEAALAGGEIAGQLKEWRSILVPLAEKSRNPPAIHRLLDALIILEAYPNPIPPSERTRLSSLVRGCLDALERRDLLTEAPPETESTPEAHAATRAFAEVQREFSRPQAPQPAHTEQKPRQLFVPDALSNPAHWQFALKTTIAIMIVYGVYTMLDWPGLLTSIVTVFFVALGSVGETVHKLTLRISGAIIGGLLAGLSIVFLIPHFTDIGQLCALTAVVALFAGWVTTSSERLSYAGMQIALAFFMGVLQTYSPANDLTVLRDRIVGILLGNVVMTLVFSSLWPESAITRLRGALADALRAIAALLRLPQNAETNRQHTVEALARADNFKTLSQFEMEMLPRQTHLPDLHSIERLAGAAFVAGSEPLARDVDARAVASLGDWLDRAARATAEDTTLPSLAEAATTATSGTAAQVAVSKLSIEAGHVASSVEIKLDPGRPAASPR